MKHWPHSRKCDGGSPFAKLQSSGQVAQLVERSPEKAGVGGSIPSLATSLKSITCMTQRPTNLKHSLSAVNNNPFKVNENTLKHTSSRKSAGVAGSIIRCDACLPEQPAQVHNHLLAVALFGSRSGVIEQRHNVTPFDIAAGRMAEDPPEGIPMMTTEVHVPEPSCRAG